MTQRSLAICALSLASAFIAALVGVMFWVYLDEPRTGPFDATFSLIDDRGNAIDQSVFRGHPSLVYFGYTHCPEICPTTLLDVSDWLRTLGPRSNKFKTYFFTVDPQRDTQSVMHAYVSYFSDKITGVTGRPEEMQKVINGWLIHAAKIPSAGTQYHMSHTTSLLLIGADGRLKDILPYGIEKKEALARIESSS